MVMSTKAGSFATLELRDNYRESNPESFKWAVLRNGSLREVILGEIVWDSGRREPMFEEYYVEKIEAYQSQSMLI
jgi:hypothetical protein